MKFYREQDRGMSLLTFAKLLLTSNYRPTVPIAGASFWVHDADGKVVEAAIHGRITSDRWRSALREILGSPAFSANN